MDKAIESARQQPMPEKSGYYFVKWVTNGGWCVAWYNSIGGKFQIPQDGRKYDRSVFVEIKLFDPDELASHASNEDIGFAEWSSENFNRSYPRGTEEVLWFPKITWTGRFKKEHYTTAELYSKYQEEKHK